MAAAGASRHDVRAARGGALGQRDTAGAATAGAGGAEDPEPRASEERAQPLGEPRPAPTFPSAGAGSCEEGAGAAARGSPPAGCGGRRSGPPTPAKLGRGGGGRRGRGAGGGTRGARGLRRPPAELDVQGLPAPRLALRGESRHWGRLSHRSRADPTNPQRPPRAGSWNPADPASQSLHYLVGGDSLISAGGGP